MKKIIFLNVGWMEKYNGLKNDKISRGGDFVKKHKSGFEIFNFSPYKNYYYGFVQPPRGKGSKNSFPDIHIDRINNKAKSEYINNVLVVWLATHEAGTRRIVGWYKDATIYRTYHEAPKGSKRISPEGWNAGYYVKALQKNCKLLSREERIFTVKKSKTGKFGQSNVWYADNKKFKDYIEAVFDYVYNSKLDNRFIVKRSSKIGKRIQQDIILRRRIEKAAIDETKKYYIKKHYKVMSVENENLGWDLNAVNDFNELKVEVKGLSGNDISIELTSNEYESMNNNKDQYRIAVLTNSLKPKKKLHIFSYIPEDNRWEDKNAKSLNIKIIKTISARMWI